MLVELVVGSLPYSGRFYSWNSGFPSPQKPTFELQFILEYKGTFKEFLRIFKYFVGKQITVYNLR